jgi:hypothetical protein
MPAQGILSDVRVRFMRVICVAALLAFCATVHAGEGPLAVYHSDPDHLWNRLYAQMATRTVGGVRFGADIAEPYLDDVDDPERLISVLDEFLKPESQNNLPRGSARALLLNDVWAAFDGAAASSRRNDRLLLRLARVLWSLRMNAAAIAELEDNYAAALAAGTFPKAPDPENPDASFLPHDLFDPNGPWVQVGESGWPVVAPTHVQMMSGRSAFMVFIRCPGGREATLAYLQRLNLHPTPWAVNSDSIGESYPSGEKVRGNVLRLHPDTPQPPEGSMVALVRRLMVIDDQFNPVVTPITQKVQFRRRSGASPGVQVFAMRRKDLLEGRHGGLHAMSRDHKEYQRLLLPIQRGDAAYFTGYPVLQRCRQCHGGNDRFAMRSYFEALERSPTEPRLPAATESDYQAIATARWKRQQFDWGLLQGLLTPQGAGLASP